ncbi:Rossmann-like and DUF2520 domain-containing protein [Parafilimonas terrae]|uniref:Predicted oxidoreductase, contains short-chain dehydrogenase (SDR) and DUF2520 domains n=1 Tax=Parafilimonas terrae TaxID=1465490 RepID=A0A1I5YNE6_9BACT|nr:Rossmann-like and DUF2520 domain-containing protein [Parafilimonas terrae]SFQ45778.1 Predicted oxidoreductase, contains short-chain dehydrogenase (SDR) and DUF2520 domains [Parafilimonas terrae]
MVISIIGSGNVATVLGKIFKENNHTINEIIGRNETAVINLASLLNAKPGFSIGHINKDSDIFIVAVKDDAVAEVSAQINAAQKIVVHTCGSVSVNVLKDASGNYGVLYPLQSLRMELNYNPEIPFLIDGNNPHTKNIIQTFASSFAKTVIQANDEVRLRYHLSAIISSNFTNHLFALTKDYCSKNNIDFKLLLPLIEETVKRLHYYDPAAMQTGPAARGDNATIQKHFTLLEAYPALKNIYAMMSESIQHNRL